MRSLLVLVLLAGLRPAWGAALPADDKVFQAMRAELDRTMRRLRMDEMMARTRGRTTA